MPLFRFQHLSSRIYRYFDQLAGLNTTFHCALLQPGPQGGARREGGALQRRNSLLRRREADERLKELGLKTFDAAIRFLDKLATDSRAVQNKAVHELIHFIANDFGEGDVPKDVPTLELIRGEIQHLNDEVANFKKHPPTHPED